MQKIIMCLSRSFGSSIFFQFRYFIPFLFKNFQILDKYFFSLSYLKRQLSEKRMKEPRKNFYRLIFEVSFILSPAQKSSMTGGGAFNEVLSFVKSCKSKAIDFHPYINQFFSLLCAVGLLNLSPYNKWRPTVFQLIYIAG